MASKVTIKLRVYVLYLIFAVFGISILTKVLYIQIVNGEKLIKKAEQMFVKEEIMEPIRGNIYSEEGSLLSTTLPTFNLYWDAVVPKKDSFNKYVDSLSFLLSTTLKDKTEAEYRKFLTSSRKKKNRYQLIKANVSFDNYLKIKTFPIFRYSKNKGGFRVEAINHRVNPFDLLANRTIGRFVKGNSQNVGLELSYNDYLSGKEGRRLMQTLAGGIKMPLDGSELEPENGKDIYTSIDVNIQEVAEHSLLEVLQNNNADFGTCIVMEVQTGKIKALANLGKQKDNTYWEDYNYALLNQYPGSTFKLISLMSMLEDTMVNIDDHINIGSGSMAVGDHVIQDDHFEKSDLTFKEAFAHSSNVAFAKSILSNYKSNPSRFINFLYKIGLDTTSQIDLVGERLPLIKDPRKSKWSNFSLAYMAMGYELLLSPIQLCAIYNGVANNGKLMRPYIVQEVREYGKTVQKFEPVVKTNMCSQKTVNALKEVMHEVILSGTGKDLNNKYYAVGGKTGTAKWADNKTAFSDNVYTASFIGFFPLENPKYTIAVTVKLPKGSANYYGSAVALPVFKSVANRLYAKEVNLIERKNNWYQIPSSDSSSFSIYESDISIFKKAIPFDLTKTSFQKYTINTNPDKRKFVVPNVRGIGLRDALYALENAGFVPLFIGNGKVVSQSIEPGTKGFYGQKIKLELN